MQVKDVMTPDPTCCTADTSLQEVAKMMVDHDCGEIPIVESKGTKQPIGVITDRDIVVRSVAKGNNPLDLTAGDCMTKPCVTVTPEMSIEECGNILETNKIRRVPVVDQSGDICGIIAVADIALRAGGNVTTEVVKEVSEPGASASAAGR
ncbi:MAG: CBS domain-containing protein [Acidobacteriota bacterium]|nr:CBS domain-containing protein [Acidobacteriota bacterium]